MSALVVGVQDLEVPEAGRAQGADVVLGDLARREGQGGDVAGEGGFPRGERVVVAPVQQTGQLRPALQQAALAGSPEAASPLAGAQPGRVSPPPATPGGPPLWLAGAHATMRRALALGLPFQASRKSPGALARWAREWHDAGGGQLAVRVRMQAGSRGSAGESVDWQTLTGPASFLADQIHAYAELGVTDISVVPGQDEKTAMATIEALAAALAPTRAARPSAPGE